jgi:hypothetical protein
MCQLKKRKKGEADEIGEGEQSKAQDSRLLLFQEQRMFAKLLENDKARLRDSYLHDIRPPSPPPPEILRIPPHTPIPRLIEMQANRGIKTIGDPTLNDWDCKDSEFAVPAAGIQLPDGPKPLSTKTFII